MPLLNHNRAVEQGTFLSGRYCDKCYDNGCFIDRDLSIDDMKKIGLTHIKKSKDLSGLRRAVMLVYYPLMLKRLDRWTPGSK